MKKVIIVLVIMTWMLLAAMSFTGCGNRSLLDTTYKFNRAIIFLPDGSKIEGKVDKWVDFESSDMIQVTVEGKTYLTHSSNVIMIAE